MAKPSRQYVCQSCGAVSTKWAGRCDACESWNTLIEEIGDGGGVGAGPAARNPAKGGRVIAFEGLSGATDEAPRIESDILEFDRVCGGGIVPGSAILVGGDPGIGKSTLLLQVMAALSNSGDASDAFIYISGEEAVAQLRMRATRLALEQANVQLAAETNLRDILASLESGAAPRAVVIDSIQTMWSDMLESAPGTVAQVRACSQQLIRFAKQRGTAMILVGHVTKEGQIAGPRVVEHMVDSVLYFEGERGHSFRILRAVKNRFGPTDEIGVFEMTGKGLAEVANPSQLFLSAREEGVPGAAVFAGIEGTRPLLVEIQALVAPSSLATPRRSVVGWDSARLAMILAVLETHCGLRFANHDVYLNVAGGLRISEPAADLAVAEALISSVSGMPIASNTIAFGEISLSGSVRPVGQAAARLKEALKLGFKSAVLPEGGNEPTGGLKTVEIGRLTDLVNHMGLGSKNGDAKTRPDMV